MGLQRAALFGVGDLPRRSKHSLARFQMDAGGAVEQGVDLFPELDSAFIAAAFLRVAANPAGDRLSQERPELTKAVGTRHAIGQRQNACEIGRPARTEQILSIARELQSF